jgi:hypothetical protein
VTVNSPDDDKQIGEEARRQEAAERGRTIAASHFPEVFAPEKKRVSWPVLFAAVIFLGLGALLYMLRPPVGGISDAEARDQIIKESVATHQASGSPCACPYNVMADGKECGGFSAYNRPGGTTPLCYPKDVTDEAIREWRQQQSKR